MEINRSSGTPNRQNNSPRELINRSSNPNNNEMTENRHQQQLEFARCTQAEVLFVTEIIPYDQNNDANTTTASELPSAIASEIPSAIASELPSETASVLGRQESVIIRSMPAGIYLNKKEFIQSLFLFAALGAITGFIFLPNFMDKLHQKYDINNECGTLSDNKLKPTATECLNSNTHNANEYAVFGGAIALLLRFAFVNIKCIFEKPPHQLT